MRRGVGRRKGLLRPSGRSPDSARPSDALRPDEVVALRQLSDENLERRRRGGCDQDWGHAVGGVHVIAEAGRARRGARIRGLYTAGHRLRTGYVEAVATRPSHQRRGLGSLVIGEVGELIDRTYRLGALATGVVGFYERLGWVAWKGPTFVRTAAGSFERPKRTGTSSVVCTPTSPELDLSGPMLRVASGRCVVVPSGSTWLGRRTEGQWIRWGSRDGSDQRDPPAIEPWLAVPDAPEALELLPERVRRGGGISTRRRRRTTGCRAALDRRGGVLDPGRPRREPGRTPGWGRSG